MVRRQLTNGREGTEAFIPMAGFTPFAHDLNAVADSLEVLRRRVCAYTSPVNAPSFCDCKYGLSDDTRNVSEQTGCPELRDAIRLLRMTDTIDLDLLKRNNRILVNALNQLASEATRVAKDFG